MGVGKLQIVGEQMLYGNLIYEERNSLVEKVDYRSRRLVDFLDEVGLVLLN